MISKWFKGQELNMAIGLDMTLCRMGNIINGLITPVLYKNYGGFGPAFGFGFIICLVALVCGIGMALIDVWFER